MNDEIGSQEAIWIDRVYQSKLSAAIESEAFLAKSVAEYLRAIKR